jgi:hypothetical protein
VPALCIGGLCRTGRLGERGWAAECCLGHTASMQ